MAIAISMSEARRKVVREVATKKNRTFFLVVSFVQRSGRSKQQRRTTKNQVSCMLYTLRASAFAYVSGHLAFELC